MSLTSLFQQLMDFDTALVANTVGHIDSTPVNEWYMGGSIASLTPTIGPTVGVAMTVEIDSSSPGNRPEPADVYYELLKAIQQSAEPVVLIIKAVGSRPDHECVLGDGMAKLLQSVGCVGVVTDGGVRDIEGILTVPFGVYARRRTIHHVPVHYTRFNHPVEIGGIKVSPGEVIHANLGGVIKIPAPALARLPKFATEMRAFEHAAHVIFRQTLLTVDEKRRALDARVAQLSGLHEL